MLATYRRSSTQGEALEQALKARGLPGVKTYIGMRYWHPFTEEERRAHARVRARALAHTPSRPRPRPRVGSALVRMLAKGFSHTQARSLAALFFAALF
eukprot:1087745-Pleurochrysis_carterae.AAC.2